MSSPNASYPRIYVLSNRARVQYKVVGWILVLWGTVVTYFFGTYIHWYKNDIPDLVIYFTVIGAYCFSPAILGVLFLTRALRVSVVLSADSVHIQDLFRSVTLKFRDILGRRRRSGKAGPVTILIPKADCQVRRSPKRPPDLAVDEFYSDWLYSLPDLDAIDKEKRRAEGKLHWWES
jgi:hypothetical protein